VHHSNRIENNVNDLMSERIAAIAERVQNIEATEIVSRWEKKKEKDCSGARPHNRLGPVGPF
jgi:hypothetical protein